MCVARMFTLQIALASASKIFANRRKASIKGMLPCVAWQTTATLSNTRAKSPPPEDPAKRARYILFIIHHTNLRRSASSNRCPHPLGCASRKWRSVELYLVKPLVLLHNPFRSCT